MEPYLTAGTLTTLLGPNLRMSETFEQHHIRILQFGNLCFSAAEGDKLSRFDPFDEDFKRICGRADYVVICGNITRDGLRESFDLAAEVLGKGIAQVLSHLNSEGAANRVLVVPGPNDVTPGDDECQEYERFRRELHVAIFKDSGGGLPNRSAGPVDYRQLKDATLIGVPFWNLSGETPRDAQKRLEELLKGQIDEPPPLDVLKRTPTILVSCETPLLAEAGNADSHLSVQPLADGKFRTWMHLFGSGNRIHVPPEPFSVSHYSLGTGSTGEVWPIRCNLVTVEWPYHRCRTHDERIDSEIKDDRVRVMANVAHLRYDPAENTPRGEWKVSPQQYWFFLRLCDVQVKNDDALMGNFLSEIEQKMFSSMHPAGAVSAQFVPGCGLHFFFRKFVTRTILKERLVDVSVIELPAAQRDWLSHFGKLTRSIGREIARDAKKREVGPTKVIAILDPSFPFARGDERKERVEQLQSFIDRWSIGFTRQRVKLIHFTYAPDDVHLGGFAILEVNAADDNAIDELHNRFAMRIPLDRRQLRAYSGTAIGITRRVLEEASQRFERKWPGDSVIDKRSPRVLLEEVLKDRKLDKSLADFRRWMGLRNSVIGDSLFMYIRDTLLRQPPGQNAVDFQGWIEAQEGGKHGWNSIGESIVRSLCACGILTSSGKSYKKVKVRVRAPFLCEIVYEIFLSFGQPQKRVAFDIKRALEETAPSLGQSVIVRNYLARNWCSTSYGTTDDAIESRLRDAAAIIFLQTGDRAVRPGIKQEIDIWRKLGGGKERPGILLIPNPSARINSEDCPDVAHLNEILYESRRSDEEWTERPPQDVAREIVAYFGPKVGMQRMRWIVTPPKLRGAPRQVET
jgi:hypothetical protein